MATPCARCTKPVYATEMVSCLGQAWHTGCFQCVVCSTRLTLKTFKGANNQPYCQNHLPAHKANYVPQNATAKSPTAAIAPFNPLKGAAPVAGVSPSAPSSVAPSRPAPAPAAAPAPAKAAAAATTDAAVADTSDKVGGIKFEDSNIANFGTKMEHDALCHGQLKHAAAETESAWKGCGLKVGLEMWRIENFKVVARPEKEIGNFYAHDAYIVLRTYQPDPAKPTLKHDIHFWIGEEATQDEYGTAAYKTVELDDHLGGEAVQHREVEGAESKQFLSYFKSVHFLKGGAQSGFHHVGPVEYKPRLLLVKGHHNIVVREVPLKASSLNSSDVFVLDNGPTIYQLETTGSTGLERVKAAEMTHALRNDRDGKPEILVFSENDTDGNLEPRGPSSKQLRQPFWELVGGRQTLEPAPPAADEPRAVEKKLYLLSDRTGSFTVTPVTPIARSSLTSDDVFILDTGFHVFVYVGKNADAAERKNGVTVATDYLTKHNLPKNVPITRIIEGGDNEPFFAALDSSD